MLPFRPRALLDRFTTPRRPTWVLVYGPVRTGTTLMGQVLATTSRRFVGDWGLEGAIVGPLGPASRIDHDRWRRMATREVLRSAAPGGGTTFDLVYKQANLRAPEYEALVSTWGPPRRTIFCLRDPSSFLASAVRKFPEVDVELQRAHSYLGTLAEYARIGGDVFLYGPGVTSGHYVDFLAPAPVARVPVVYKGHTADDLATPEMWEAFRSMLSKVTGGPCPPRLPGS